MKQYPVLVLVAVLLFSGCAAKNKLVGTWEGDVSQLGQKIVLNQVMNADGTFVQVMKVPTSQEAGAVPAEITIKGTWTSTEESKITMTPNEVSVTGVPKEREPMVKSQFESEKGKPQQAVLKWNGNDEFALSAPDGPSITLKRK